jgi:hypothetical protein
MHHAHVPLVHQQVVVGRRYVDITMPYLFAVLRLERRELACAAENPGQHAGTFRRKMEYDEYSGRQVLR